MKSMRIILVITYVLLIIMLLLGLLLNGCRRCSMPDISLPTISSDSLAERARTIGQEGDLKVTLLWDYYADVDLHVIEPNGHEIYFSDKRSSTGGYLDVDNTAGGPQSAENMFWENPPHGEYQVILVYYAKRTKQPKEGPCKVYVFKRGEQEQVFTVNLSEAQLKERVPVTTINY